MIWDTIEARKAVLAVAIWAAEENHRQPFWRLSRRRFLQRVVTAKNREAAQLQGALEREGA